MKLKKFFQYVSHEKSLEENDKISTRFTQTLTV